MEYFNIKDWILQIKRIEYQIKNQLLTERISEFLYGNALEDSEHQTAYNAISEDDRRVISEYSPGALLTEGVLDAFWRYCDAVPENNYYKKNTRAMRKVQPYLTDKDMLTLSEFERAEKVAEKLLERRAAQGGK